MLEEELKEIHDLYGKNSPEKDNALENLFRRVRSKAKENEADLRNYISFLDPLSLDNSFKLGYLYEALAPDANYWEALYARELDRLLSLCEGNPKNKNLFSLLGCMMFIEGHSSEKLKMIFRSRLVTASLSSNASVRRIAVDLIGGLDYASDPAALDVLRKSLTDSDWRVRYFAEMSFTDDGQLPQGYKTKWIDKIYRRVFSGLEYV